VAIETAKREYKIRTNLIMRTLLVLLLIGVPCCQSFGQDGKTIIGTWVIEKVKVWTSVKVVNNGQEFTENLDADTLKFTNTTFEQKAIAKEERTKKFLWNQSGKYKIHRNKLVLSNRISSAGEPGKEYPEIRYKFKLERGQLILISTNELHDTFWRYYRKME
jgi:hypothetical protein